MEKRIIEYIIIDADNAEEVTKEVNAHLAFNWQPYGELKVVGYFADFGDGEMQHIFSYSQAMVLRESDETE